MKTPIRITSAKRESSWLKKRHALVRTLFKPLLRLVVHLKYKIQTVRFKEQGKRPYLILYNHQTPFDQFFVEMSFKGPIYYVATEDIFSMGWISSVIKWLVAPIPIQKQSLDLNAVKTILKVAKEGGTIAIAPEGNRTYSGKTEYMNPAIAHLAKKLKLPIALFRIEGGYGVEPRWSDKTRKGQMKSYVSRVIEPEEFASMSKDTLMEEIQKGLYVNEAAKDGLFRSRKKAEFLERAIYVCPFCGFSPFYSQGNEVECLTCHRKITYHEDKHLSGVGFDFPFTFVNDWYEYQKDFVNHFDPFSEEASPTDSPQGLVGDALRGACLFHDTAEVSRVIPYKHKVPLYPKASLFLYGDKVEIVPSEGDSLIIPFDELQGAAVLGHNKLNLFYQDTIYQFKGDKHFNALKYMNLFYRFKNLVSEDKHGEFLGL